MRTYIRKYVDISQPVDLTKLKGWERVITSFRYKWSQLGITSQYKEKQENKIYETRMKQIEELKGVLLYKLNQELTKKSTKVKKIRITIARAYEKILEETLSSVDFIAYDIKIIEENRDFFLAFPELPIMLEVSRK